jgi:hypothetical protein
MSRNADEARGFTVHNPHEKPSMVTPHAPLPGSPPPRKPRGDKIKPGARASRQSDNGAGPGAPANETQQQ